VSNIFRIPGQEALADALCEASFADARARGMLGAGVD